jgi:hypothetical protein
MPERLFVDHRARSDAARAIALVETHIAVCEERGKQEEAFRTRTEDFLTRFEAASQSALAEIHGQIDALGDRLHAELRKHQEDDARTLRELEASRTGVMLEIASRISAATRPIYNRFWALATALIGGLLLLSGFLAGKLLGWV